MVKYRMPWEVLQQCGHLQGWRTTARILPRCMATVAAGNQSQENDLASAKPFEDIPSFAVLPFVGTAWNYMPLIGKFRLDQQHLAAKEKRRLLGDVLRERFGKLDLVVSFRAEDLETVFKNEGPYPSRGELSSIKAYRESRKQWYSTTGIMVLQGKEWHDLRSKTQKHLLKPKAIQAYLDPMQDVARDLVRRVWELRDSNNEVPNLLLELYKWALESVAYVGLDTRLGCLRSDLSPDSDGMRLINSVQAQFEGINNLEGFTGNIQFWKWFPTPAWKKYVRAGDEFTEIAFKYINRAVEELEKNKNNEDKELTLLQNMLLTKGLDASKAMVTVADMLTAGIDTTSHSIGFMLYNLARNPEKQELLYEEISKLLPSKEDRITPEIFGELKYLKACMKESQRLTPIVGGSARTLEKDVVISGYRVPAGTIIAVGLQEISVDERYFDDPLTFSPERWLDKDKKSHPFAFLPFGFGTRSCIGRRLAELEIICLATELMRNFRVEYHHEDIGMFTRLINIPDRPLRYNFIER